MTGIWDSADPPPWPPEPGSIWEAGCDTHGPHPGTVTCVWCLAIVNDLIARCLAVLYDPRLPDLPQRYTLEDHALTAETPDEARRVRDDLVAALRAARAAP